MRFINLNESDSSAYENRRSIYGYYVNKEYEIPEYTEMDKLIPLLCKADIPFDLTVIFGRPQIVYPSVYSCVCDVICNRWSYGGSDGLLEISGITDDSFEDGVEGYLTAEEVFDRISKHYHSSCAKE